MGVGWVGGESQFSVVTCLGVKFLRWASSKTSENFLSAEPFFCS